MRVESSHVFNSEVDVLMDFFLFCREETRDLRVMRLCGSLANSFFSLKR